MNREYSATLYDYNYWATERILSAAEKLTDAQFTAPGKYSHGGLRGTLLHTMLAEWIRLQRWNGISTTTRPHAEEEFPNLTALRARWREEEVKMRAFLAGLREEDFTRVIEYKSMRGMSFTRPLWQMLAHVVNHGTQHRAEAAVMLTDLGHSPGDIDFTIFLDERKK